MRIKYYNLLLLSKRDILNKYYRIDINHNQRMFKMIHEKKGMGKGILMGILTGAAAGSIIALLYAPKSGEKLREDIKTKSQDFIDDFGKYISNAKKDASQFIKGVKKKSKILVEDSENKVEALLDETEKILSDAKEKVEDYAQAGRVNLEKQSERFKSAIKARMHSYKADKKT